MNCLSCNSFVQPNSNYCANCGSPLRIQHGGNRQQVSQGVNNLLIFLCIYITGEVFIYLFATMLDYFFGTNVWQYTRLIYIVLTLCYSTFPLIISRFLPKDSSARSVFLILGIILVAIKFIWTLYYEFFVVNFGF